MKFLSKSNLGRQLATVALMSAISMPLIAESAQDYNGVTIGESQTLYISPLWLTSGGLEQQDGGDSFGTMAVAGEVVYISDCSDSSVKQLRRYDRSTGTRLSDLPITYPSAIDAPAGAITHVGTDGDGVLYVWSGLADGSEPVVDIDVVNAESGEVTQRIVHKLAEILPDRYTAISSIHLGHPQITGSLASGNYELALTETFSTEGSSVIGIRLWRIPMVNGSADDPRASKLLLPNDETDGKIDAFIPVDNDARVTMIDDRKSIVDDGTNRPMYFRVRNLGVNVNSRLEASDGTSPAAKANGVSIFNWGDQRLIVYGNSVDNGVNFVVAHWKDTSAGIDGDNIEKLWTLPQTAFGTPQGKAPVTLSCAVPHQGNDGRIDLYVYSSGSGLGAYAIGTEQYSGTSDLQEIGFVAPGVEISGSTVRLTRPEPVEVVSVDGRVALLSSAALTHDLSGLATGVYIVKVSGSSHKVYIP